jgi:hypothetical protein
VRGDGALRRTLAAALLLALAGATPAFADDVGDCERHFIQFARKQGWQVSAFVIDRGASLVVNRFDDQVGSQRVSTEYMGHARLSDSAGARRAGFICLHAGAGRRAVYVGVLPP